MAKEPIDYNKVLDDIRHIYKQKYNVQIDDELLYMIIRINEMQVFITSKIEDIPKLTFKSGSDYFYYNLGKYMPFLILGIGLCLVTGYLYFSKQAAVEKTYTLRQDPSGLTVKLNSYKGTSDTTLFFDTPRQPKPTTKPRAKKIQEVALPKVILDSQQQ